MPFPENAPRPDDLLTLSPQEVAELPVELLATLQGEVDETLQRVKTMKARLDGALTIRYAERAAAARAAEGKDTGTVRFEDGDFTVVADLPKRVTWDQAQLVRMVERIRAAGEDPADYVEVRLKVAERKYAAWPEPIRQGFTPARTVRTGSLSVALVAREAD